MVFKGICNRMKILEQRSRIFTLNKLFGVVRYGLCLFIILFVNQVLASETLAIENLPLFTESEETYAKQKFIRELREKYHLRMGLEVIKKEQWDKFHKDAHTSTIASVFEGINFVPNFNLRGIGLYIKYYSSYCSESSTYELSSIQYEEVQEIVNGYGTTVDEIRRPKTLYFRDAFSEYKYINKATEPKTQFNSRDKEYYTTIEFFENYKCNSKQMKQLDENMLRIVRGIPALQVERAAKSVELQYMHIHPNLFIESWEVEIGYFGQLGSWRPDFDEALRIVKPIFERKYKQKFPKADIRSIVFDSLEPVSSNPGLHRMQVIRFGSLSTGFFEALEDVRNYPTPNEFPVLLCRYYDESGQTDNIYWYKVIPKGWERANLISPSKEIQPTPLLFIGGPRETCPKAPFVEWNIWKVNRGYSGIPNRKPLQTITPHAEEKIVDTRSPFLPSLVSQPRYRKINEPKSIPLPKGFAFADYGNDALLAEWGSPQINNESKKADIDSDFPYPVDIRFVGMKISDLIASSGYVEFREFLEEHGVDVENDVIEVLDDRVKYISPWLKQLSGRSFTYRIPGSEKINGTIKFNETDVIWVDDKGVRSKPEILLLPLKSDSNGNTQLGNEMQCLKIPSLEGMCHTILYAPEQSDEVNKRPISSKEKTLYKLKGDLRLKNRHEGVNYFLIAFSKAPTTLNGFAEVEIEGQLLPQERKSDSN